MGLAVLVAGCGKTRSTLAPGELLREGWMHFRLQEFDSAEIDFQAALDKLPAEGKPLRLQAMYGLGMVASLGRGGEQGAAAEKWFGEVMKLDPDGEMGAWAALGLARDKHLYGRGDLAALKTGYAGVVEKFPTSAAAEEAFMYRTSLLVQTFDAGDAREAVRELTGWIEKHPGGKLRTALFALLSQAQETLHDYPAALAAAIASLESKENDPQNPYQSNILEYYRIGMMAQYDVGDFATARKYYERFLKEYPRDQRAFTVALMLKQIELNEAELRSGKPVTEISQLGGTP